MLSNKRYSIADGWKKGILLLNIFADDFVGGWPFARRIKAACGNSRSLHLSNTAGRRHDLIPGRFIGTLRLWQTSRCTFSRSAGSEGDLHIHGVRDSPLELAQGQTVHDDQNALRILGD